MTGLHVYEAITAVTATMAREGIGKSRKNEQQGYRFRSVDDVYAAIGGLLAANKICMLPRVTERSMVERPTKSGGVSTYATLTVEFDIVSAVDGSKHTVCTMGEAMDMADKATNKAMSAAFKYACFLAFQIPVEGSVDNDTDFHHHEKATAEPALEKQLDASVKWAQWEKRAAADLAKAQNKGALNEAWADVFPDAKRAPNGTLKRLSAVKEECERMLAGNGSGARP
jgi:hypothetical protein